MKRKHISIASCIFLLLMVMGVCGCANNSTDAMEGMTVNTRFNEDEVILNGRQKEILIKKGLPTDYEELTYMQKQAIVAIEEMLSTVETKYGASFEFISYTNDKFLGKEQLVAIPDGGDPDLDFFTITRTKESDKYIYTDGYANLAAKPAFNEFILQYCKTQLGDGDVKVYSMVSNIYSDEIPLTVDDIAHNVDGNNWIFIDGNAVSDARFDQFLIDYSSWLRDNDISGSNDIILLNAGELKFVTQINYANYLSKEHWQRSELIQT